VHQLNVLLLLHGREEVRVYGLMNGVWCSSRVRVCECMCVSVSRRAPILCGGVSRLNHHDDES
jgi:hypothetical protein